MVELLSKLFIKNYKDYKDKKVRADYGTLSAVVGIIVNVILALGKMLVGIFTSSVSIVADAINNFSDAGSSIITFLSFRIALKPADRDHPYGHGRIEYVTSMIVSMLVLLVGFELLTSSLDGILHPTNETSVNIVTAIILLCSILAKLGLGLFNKKIAKRVESTVIEATVADSISDAMSTGAVLIGVIVTLIFPEAAFTLYIDSVLGLLVSAIILISGAKILIETKNLILGVAPTEEEQHQIVEVVKRHPEALGIHDMVIHNYGPGHTVASLHVEVDGSQNMFDVHDVIDCIESELLVELGVVCTIHTDPISLDADVKELKEHVIKLVKSIDERFSIHDFRIVTGKTHSNLLFDVNVPFEYKENDDETKKIIQELIHNDNNHYYAVIHIDRS